MLCAVYRYWYKKTACKEFPKYITEQKKDKKKSWVLFSHLMTKKGKRSFDDKKHHQSPTDSLWQPE